MNLKLRVFRKLKKLKGSATNENYYVLSLIFYSAHFILLAVQWSFTKLFTDHEKKNTAPAR